MTAEQEQQRERLEREVANALARAEWGSKCPHLGVDDDVPGGAQGHNYLAAAVAISIIASRCAEVAMVVCEKEHDLSQEAHVAYSIATSIRALAGEP